MRLKRFERRAKRKQTLEDILKLQDEIAYGVSDIRGNPIGSEGNWTEDGARSEFGWKFTTPSELIHENDHMTEDTVRSTKHQTKRWNGQGVS